MTLTYRTSMSSTTTTWESVRRTEYDAVYSLRFAYSMGVVPQEVLKLPLELVNELYPGFATDGLVALIGDYVNRHARKANVSLILDKKAESRMILATPSWMSRLEDDEFDKFSPAFYVKHISLAWPRATQNPPHAPKGSTVSAEYVIRLLDSAPDFLIAALPVQVRGWYNAKRLPISPAPAIWSNTTGASLLPKRYGA